MKIGVPKIPTTPREVTRTENQASKPPKPRLPRLLPKVRVKPPKFRLMPNIRGMGGLNA